MIGRWHRPILGMAALFFPNIAVADECPWPADLRTVEGQVASGFKTENGEDRELALGSVLVWTDAVYRPESELILCVYEAGEQKHMVVFFKWGVVNKRGFFHTKPNWIEWDSNGLYGCMKSRAACSF
ncbi:MAG: hypothetical protein V3T65_06335 [Acidobacteriota bacterium]